ncbi:hypothetical protein [Haloplanus natans]|nr:hypothetical protein [Haloplanus natans]
MRNRGLEGSRSDRPVRPYERWLRFQRGDVNGDEYIRIEPTAFGDAEEN